MKKKSAIFLLTLGLFAAVVCLSGCNGLTSTSSSTTTAPANPESLPPVTGFAGDIQDIVLPTELEWDRKSSMGIKTESFIGGVYVYKGNVSILSLKDFMTQSMKDNHWRIVGETASSEVLLAFVKENKTCMMVLKEGNLINQTVLTFYVTIHKAMTTAPTGTVSAAKPYTSYNETVIQ